MTTTRLDPSGWRVRWDAQRAGMLATTGAWAGKTMAEVAAPIVESEPDRVLLIDGDVRLEAGELFRQARQLAGALIARGLKPGDRISCQLPNWHEIVVIDMAATMAGLIVNPLVAIYREAEVRFMMTDCGSRMLFIPSLFRNHDYVSMAENMLGDLPDGTEVVVLRGDPGPFTAYGALLADGDEQAPLPHVDPSSVKMVLYTSGTTGRAKGVLHTHNTVSAMAEQFRRHLQVTASDTTLVASPITHITGAIWACQFPWISGARAVLMDVWSGPRAVDLIKANDISIANGAAPFLRDLLAAVEGTEEVLPTLRMFVAGGSVIPEQLGRAAYDRFVNCAMFRCYGATETPSASAGDPDRRQMRLNITTDGRPLETELRIVDPSGTDVPYGQEGEILLRGAQTMPGYLRAEDNAEAFDAEGYFRSGDLGRFVEDDWIEISGRKKDIVIRAGENLSAKEIEDALLDHPAIEQIAVVAKPDPRTGEAACAFVVTHPGHMIDLPAIATFLTAQGFAKQKIPEHLVLVGELPQTASGKVQKHILRERAGRI